jgi:hypothetical protein
MPSIKWEFRKQKQHHWIGSEEVINILLEVFFVGRNTLLKKEVFFELLFV